MKATLLLRRRIALSPNEFAELVLWQVPQPVKGSAHSYKYRLAFVVAGQCVVRYDNEAGKGDHRHYGQSERAYKFVDVERLQADFMQDIQRWRDENGNA
jgi:hypothetical protein